MWRLSLVARFNLLMGATFLALLVLNVVTLTERVHSDFESEVRADLKLARELAVMETVRGGDPVARLRQVFDDPDYRRRVDVRTIWSAPPGREAEPPPSSAPDAPAGPRWFLAFAAPAPRTSRIPVTVNGMMKFGDIELTFYPDFEAGKAWSSVTRLLTLNTAAICLLFAGVLAVMHRWLHPFKEIGASLSDLERGARNIHLAAAGATEFQDIGRKVNTLAATLSIVEEEKRSLLMRLVKAQDVERANVARDLHDEVAPCLFAIRASALALTQNGAVDQKLQGVVQQIGAAANALQDIVRRMLDELRPPGLAEHGLEPALRGLIASLQAARPELEISFDARHELAGLGKAVEVTAYRVVQEALTNVYRHARARRASVSLGMVETPHAENAGGALALHIVVADDGVGVTDTQKKGRGLVGMAERVEALNGLLNMRARPDGGAVVDVVLPLFEPAQSAG